MVPAVVEVKVVNMGLSPSLSASQWEGLSTMGYRHTEPFAKSARQREMFGSGLGGIYNIQIEEVQIEIYFLSKHFTWICSCASIEAGKTSI